MPRRAGMAESDADGRLMGTSSGGAARASDDGALLTVINQPVIPELSLIGQQQHEQELVNVACIVLRVVAHKDMS